VLRSKIHFTRDRPGHDLRYSLDSSKIKKHLKWKCKYNFNEGIKNTIIWYVDAFNKNFFKNKDFQNRIGLKT
jgi:dTDP-glucose 4,6-dehydratase